MTAIFKIALFIVLGYNLYTKFSGEHFQKAYDTFINDFSIHNIHYLLIAISLTFVNWGLETLKFYITIQRVEPISYFKAYRGILFGNALNLILPMSIGELTGRPLVLKPDNRAEGSGVAYYVSIVQKVASPFMGLIFFAIAVSMNFLQNSIINIGDYSFDAFYFILVISIVDFLFWCILFFKPTLILHLLERISCLKSIFLRIEKALVYSQATKFKLIAIGMIRYMVFVTQYWVLTFLFFQDFPHFTFFILSGVYFLAQFVIPSVGVSDLMLRATLVSMVFADFTDHILQLLAVNIMIYFINVIIPSLLGFWLMRHTVVPNLKDLELDN